MENNLIGEQGGGKDNKGLKRHELKGALKALLRKRLTVDNLDQDLENTENEFYKIVNTNDNQTSEPEHGGENELAIPETMEGKINLLTAHYGDKIKDLYNNTENLTLKTLVEEELEKINNYSPYGTYEFATLLEKKAFSIFIEFCKQNNNSIYEIIINDQNIKTTITGKLFKRKLYHGGISRNQEIYKKYIRWVETGEL
jgi:hypothetical protein